MTALDSQHLKAHRAIRDEAGAQAHEASEFHINPLADHVNRCVLRWEPDVYYWLAPGDRDEWLEVSSESFDEARLDPAVAAEALRLKLDGLDEHGKRIAGIPLRATRRWLEQQGRLHDGAVFDTV